MVVNEAETCVNGDGDGANTDGMNSDGLHSDGVHGVTTMNSDSIVFHGIRRLTI
jgi:hypothetical protein